MREPWCVGLLHHKPPIIMNIKKIRRLMKKYGLFCPIRKANPYKRMAKAIRTNTVADYLLKRRFKEFGPRMVLLTDKGKSGADGAAKRQSINSLSGITLRRKSPPRRRPPS